MEHEENIFERTYKHLNSTTALKMSRDQWFPLLAGFLAMVVPDVTGYPAKYAAPVTLFLLIGGETIVRERSSGWKKIPILAAVCLCFYVVLEMLYRFASAMLPF